MAKYDQGGGCPCGLKKKCDCEYSEKDIEMTKKKETLSVDESYDFGFSAVSDDDLQKLKEEETGKKPLQDRLDAVYSSIMPLLDNLEKDSDKPNIYWPDRDKKISEFKQKLEKYYEGDF